MIRLAYDVTVAELQEEMEATEAELMRLRGRPRRMDLPPLHALLAGVAGWASAIEAADPAAVRRALETLLARV